MAAHRRSNRFKDDGFEIKILEESTNENYILEREEYWISKLDTFNNGLNESWSGKGYGHNSLNFTTSGYVFTDKQRKKMSESAKKRVNTDKMRQISLDMWADPEKRKHHSEIRKGRRLRAPLISDETIDLIRKHYEKKKEDYVLQKMRNGRISSPSRQFANQFSNYYGISNTFLKDIVENKVRIKICPLI